MERRFRDEKCRDLLATETNDLLLNYAKDMSVRKKTVVRRKRRNSPVLQCSSARSIIECEPRAGGWPQVVAIETGADPVASPIRSLPIQRLSQNILSSLRPTRTFGPILMLLPGGQCCVPSRSVVEVCGDEKVRQEKRETRRAR